MMDFPTIGGLPAHPLIVHATVVLVPLAAAAVALHTFWPAARARLGVVTLGAAVLAVILVPLSTSSGEQLEHDVPRTALVEQHTELADGLLPWVLGLLVVAVLLAVRDVMAQCGVGRVRVPEGAATTVATALTRPVVLGILTVLVVVGTTQQVVRIGHSGAKASWNDVASTAKR
jgi:hypothetical protein